MMKGKICQIKRFEKYLVIEESCLSGTEKKEVMDMLYKYKDTVSLKDGIGMSKHTGRNRSYR